MIIFDYEPYAHQIAQAAGTSFNPATDKCICRIDDDTQELLGGVIYTGYTTNGSVHMHVASFRDKWINRDLLWVCFHYPFVQLNCKKVFGQVPAKNKKALTFDLKLGFRIEHTIKDVFGDGDLYLLAMYKSDCPWLNITPRGIAVKEAA